MQNKNKKLKASITFQGAVTMKQQLEKFARTKDLWYGESGNITKAVIILLRYALAHAEDAWEFYAKGGQEK